MPNLSAPARPSPPWLRALGALLVLAGVLTLLPAALDAAYHCDETTVFRHVTKFAAGEVGRPGRPGLLWLLLAPIAGLLDPISAARGLRLASVGASGFTLLLVWRLAVRSRGDEATISGSGAWAGLAALTVLITSASWQGHAFEVRTDTFVPPLILGSMLLLWRPAPQHRQLLAAAVLLGMAGLFSQKSVYNAVAVGIAWAGYLLVGVRPLRPTRRFAHAGIVAAAALGVLGLWFVGIGLISGRGGGVAEQAVRVGVNTAFSSDITFAKKLGWAGLTFDRAPVLWSLAVAAAPVAILGARRNPRGFAALLTGGLLVATIGFHRGYRVYYIASMEPYLAAGIGAAAGGALAWLARKVHPAASLALVLAVGAAGVHAGLPHHRRLLQTSNAPQLQVIRDAREAFPEPVPYWDSVALLPGYPETTFLGTGMKRNQMRRIHGRDGYIELARERKPRFFVRTYMTRDRFLRGKEPVWHWTHFLPYRNNLYLHGARMRVDRAGRKTERNVQPWVDGAYTVWFHGGWIGEAWLDGQPVQHGQTVQMSAGKRRIGAQAREGGGQLWFLLGEGRVPTIRKAAEQVDRSLFPQDERRRYQQYDRKGHTADLLTPGNDPSLSQASYAARKKRHRSWQAKRDRKLGTP